MSKKIYLKAFCIVMFLSAPQLFFTKETVALEKSYAKKTNELSICYNTLEINKTKGLSKGIIHKRIKKWLNGKPAIVNIIKINPQLSNTVIKPTYGEYLLNTVRSVKEFASQENAVAAINASFFKPDVGVPLGVSIIDGELLTGPIYKRVVFGVTENNEFLMDKLEITGEIKIGDDLELSLLNFNQPVQTKYGYTIFTDRWGEKTPVTSPDFCHIVVKNDRIEVVKQSSVKIPENGYVIVGPRWPLRGHIDKYYRVSYSMKIIPEEWARVKYAIGGGPYLVKNGKKFIDRQRFTDKFLWKKEPRTAIGYSRAGTLILVTVDGRRKGISEGATMPELAQIMWELGAYNAMNLDGGSSTQMIYKGELVNMPTVEGGGKVTNALLIIPASFFHK